MEEDYKNLQSMEAEMSVLGSMLIDPESYYKIAEKIGVDDFTVQAHQILFSAFVALFNSGRPVDMVTLGQMLEDNGQIEKVTRSYMAALTNAVPTSTSIVHYANIVKDKSVRRQLLQAALKIQSEVYDESKDLDTILAASQNRVYEVTPFRSVKDDVNTIVNEIEAVQAEYAEKYQQGKRLLGISCGFQIIDDIIDGLRPGHVWVVGAWTSTGKTQFALNIVNHVLMQEVPVTIISLEMSRVDTVARLIGIRNNISSMRVLKGKNDKDQYERIEEGKIFMRQAPLEVHTTFFELEKIKAIIRRDVFSRKVKFVVIDYVQNIISDRGQKEYETMTKAATQLQSLARELGITIYIVSQISNEGEKGMAAGAGFKGSGALEAVADLAIRLKRDKSEEKPEDEFIPLQINVTKNRHGLTASLDNHYMWIKSGLVEHKPGFIYIPQSVVGNLKK